MGEVRKRFLAVLMIICLVWSLPGNIYTTQAKKTKEQLSDAIVVNPEEAEERISEDPESYKADVDTLSILHASDVDANAASVSKLDDSIIGKGDSWNYIFYSKNKNGIYFISIRNGNCKIIYYDIDTKTYKEVYNLVNMNDYYVDDTALYVATYTMKSTNEIVDGQQVSRFHYDVDIHKFDFATEQEEIVSLETQHWQEKYFDPIEGLGVDKLGRIFMAFSGNRIAVFDTSGKKISEATCPNDFWEFSGFDEESGNFFYQAVTIWSVWGHEQRMISLMAGNIDKNNKITLSKEEITMLYTHTFYTHERPVEKIDDGKLAVLSVITDEMYVMDTNKYNINDHGVKENIYNMNGEVASSLYDITDASVVKLRCNTSYSIVVNTTDVADFGSRCCYYSNQDAYIVKTRENVLTQYDAEGKRVVDYKTTYPVYNFYMKGDTCIVVEWDGEDYYVENIDWRYPSDFQASVKSGIQVGESTPIVCDAKGNFIFDYTFSSSDPTIASVDKLGNVVGWKKGTVQITVKCLQLNITKTLTLSVTDSATSSSSMTYKLTKTKGAPSATIHRPTSKTYYGVPVTSYLTETANGGYQRLERIDKKLVIEDYDSNKSLTNQRYIDLELPLYGGCFFGEKYNFVVVGQENPKERDDVEVIRVIKYDKNWKRIGACAIKGANTYIPFRAGSLSMTECDGSLYVYTCHEMYKSDDGNHHQANCTFVIDESKMTMKDSFSGVMNINYGYVSHSFMQLIRNDGNRIYRVDLGDAFPRAIVMTSIKPGDKVTQTIQRFPLVEINGAIGQNYTGFSLSGLEMTRDYYTVAGNGVHTIDDRYRNIWINSGPKSNWIFGAKWLTNYGEKDKVTLGQPKLVKLNENQQLIMWEEYREEKQSYLTKIALLTPDGELASDIYSTPLALAVNQPIVNSKGNVVWYVTNGEAPIFVELNPYRLGEIANASKSDTTFKVDKTNAVNDYGWSNNWKEDFWSEEAQTSTNSGIQVDGSLTGGKTQIGTTFHSGKLKYKITSAKEVSVAGIAKKNLTSLTIPKTVRSNGITYKVTAVSSSAFKSQKKLKKVTIGSNVKKIGSKAFYNCKKLKSIVVKSKNVKSIGSKALKGTSKSLVIKVPSAKVKAYQKLFKKKGNTKAKVKK